MKTKIRTNIAILALITIGFININAIADNKKLVNVDVNSAKAETILDESLITESVLVYSAEAYTYRDVVAEIENFEAERILSEGNSLNEESLIYSAKAFSDVEFEKEIAEYVAE